MKRYESTVEVTGAPAEVFEFVDDHQAFSGHMNSSSWMMGASRMRTSVDEGAGRSVGSHIRMNGRVMGMQVELDEVVTERDPPARKAWATVGEPQLVVVGGYNMQVDVSPNGLGSKVRVAIEYDLPRRRAWLGKLFGTWYARWCVKQMADGVRAHFATAPGRMTHL